MRTEMISIMRHIRDDDVPQQIAQVPFCSGEYATDEGLLTLKVGKIRKDHHQKVIFSGGVIPTIKERGKKGQFIPPSENPRRVVNFPPSPNSEVTQEVGLKEYLIFKRSKI